MKHNSKSFGAEAEGNPLCGVLWQGGRWRGGLLFVPLRTTAKAPG